MSHIQRGQGFHRLDETATHTLGPRVFGTCRWIRPEKGCVVSVVVVGQPGPRAKGER